MKLSGRVEGLDTLSTGLAAIAEEAAFAPDLKATAEDIRARAAASLADGAPPESRSGVLARSLAVAQGDDGAVTVGTPLDYGWHLEFGSRARPARPWLAPAAEDARPGFVTRIASRMNAVLAAALRRGG